MEEFIEKLGVGLRPMDDPFFDDSYNACKIFQRKGITVEDDEELCHEVMKEFPCYVNGCKATFHTLLDFEMHYNSTHRYVCSECKKSLPSPRLLDIHVQETHDSFFQILSTKQPMYQCYISECDLKLNDTVERRTHCISAHKFPKNFRYDSAPRYGKNEFKDQMDVDESQHKNKDSKVRKVLLNKNQKNRMFTAAPKGTVATASNVHENQPNFSNVASGSSALAFIPRQIKKSYTNALTKNENHEKDVLETGCMMDLVDSLPN